MAWGTRRIRLDNVYDVEADLETASPVSGRAAFQKLPQEDAEDEGLLSGADMQQAPATLKTEPVT